MDRTTPSSLGAPDARPTPRLPPRPPSRGRHDRRGAAAIRSERLDLCSYLEAVGPDAWSTPSLCGDWTIHEVVAHLTLSTRESWRDFLVGMIRHRGNFDRLVAAQARARAARFSPSELIEQLRVSAESTARAPGSGPLDPLLDLLVHGQDIARPLGHERRPPTDSAIAALDHALTSRWYGARRRVAGVRLVASDAEWANGTGPEVHGPLSAFLLVATGRPAGLEDLVGDGLVTLTPRLHPGARP